MGSMRRVWRAGTAAILVLALVATAGPAAAATIDITVANTGTRPIDGLYLSLSATDDWGPDQLNGVALGEGGTFVVRGVACTTGSIVVVAEDAGGCFLYRSVSCGGDASWTITNTSTRDCGR